MTEPAPDTTPWQPPAAAEAEKRAAAPEPVEPRREPTGGNYLPLREALVTLLAPAAVYATQSITIPGADAGTFDNFPTLPPQLTIGALGLAPFVSAFLLVELAAVLFPGWRNLRDGSIAGRAKLWRAAVWIGLGLALLQAVFVWLNLRAISFDGEPLIPEPAALLTILVLAIFIGTTVALYVVAHVIDRYGLINGFAAILISALLINLITGVLDLAKNGELEASETLPALAGIGACTFLAATLFLGRRPWKNVSYGGVVVPRPASGDAPIRFAATMLILPATLENFGVELGLAASIPSPGSIEYSIANAVLIAAGVLFFGWLFNRPEHVARFYPGASIADARAALRSSLFQTVILLVALNAAQTTWSNPLVDTIGLLPLLFSIAVALDLGSEWRARSAMRDLVLVGREARPHSAYAAIRALEEHDIPVFARAYYTRAIQQFFAPYIPIDLYVPAAHSERASELLRELRAQVGEQ